MSIDGMTEGQFKEQVSDRHYADKDYQAWQKKCGREHTDHFCSLLPCELYPSSDMEPHFDKVNDCKKVVVLVALFVKNIFNWKRFRQQKAVFDLANEVKVCVLGMKRTLGAIPGEDDSRHIELSVIQQRFIHEEDRAGRAIDVMVSAERAFHRLYLPFLALRPQNTKEPWTDWRANFALSKNKDLVVDNCYFKTFQKFVTDTQEQRQEFSKRLRDLYTEADRVAYQYSSVFKVLFSDAPTSDARLSEAMEAYKRAAQALHDSSPIFQRSCEGR